MNTNVLLNFLDGLERSGILNRTANQKIQEFLDYSTRSTGKLFLIISGLMGAMFVSAGIFALIAHNWSDFPKHLRGVLSLVPSLVALYFYYIALFKHNKSTVWIEASSLFLMLMIGASISLVSQTYQMDGDFNKFITVWLALTLPLFYLARASGIALFYLGLNCVFLYPHIDIGFFGPSSFEYNENFYRYWIFLLAFLPHYVLTLKRDSQKQGFRAIYLGWLLAFVLFFTLGLAVKAGYVWWHLGLLMAFYLAGKRFYGGNVSHFGRPFQTFALYIMFFVPLWMTNDFLFDELFENEGHQKLDIFNAEQIFFYFTGIIFAITMTVLAFMYQLKKATLNWFIVIFPCLFVLLFGIYCLEEYLDFDMLWLAFFLLNFYILGFGINAMIQGNRSKNILYMMYGLFLVSFQLWARYADMDISFWFKGILFIGVGGIFFLINYLSTDEFEDQQ